MAQFENAVGYIPQTAKQFQQDPFMVGANAFVPLNRGLSYQKNLLGLWADADTQQSKINATNAINNFKTAESDINTRKIRGIDEAIAAQMGYALNPDGTFKPLEDASQMAASSVFNPYARAYLIDAGRKGAADSATREAWLDPESSIHKQQGFGILPRGVTINPTGDGRFQVSDGTRVLGTYTQAEMSMILSGVGNTNKVGATQLSFGDFENKAAVKFDYDKQLANLKHGWDLEIAQAQAQGKAASAQATNNVKALEGFQKFVTDQGLLSAAVSGDPQAIQQLQGYAAYTEQAYGLAPGTITSIFLGTDSGPSITTDVAKVGEAFKPAVPAQPAPAPTPAQPSAPINPGTVGLPWQIQGGVR